MEIMGVGWKKMSKTILFYVTWLIITSIFAFTLDKTIIEVIFRYIFTFLFVTSCYVIFNKFRERNGNDD